MDHNLPTIADQRSQYANYRTTLLQQLVTYLHILPELELRIPGDDKILPLTLREPHYVVDFLITDGGVYFLHEGQEATSTESDFMAYEHASVELLLDLYEVVSARAEAFLAESSAVHIAALQRLLAEAGGELTIKAPQNRLLVGRFRQYPMSPFTFRTTEIRLEPRQTGNLTSPGQTYAYQDLSLEELSSLRRILLGFVLLHTVS